MGTTPLPYQHVFYGLSNTLQRFFRGHTRQSRGVAYKLVVMYWLVSAIIVSDMATDTTFVLDIDEAGKQILQDMAADIVQQSGQAILQRATRMAASLTTKPPAFEITNQVGTIKIGKRAFATITAPDTGDPHQMYIAHEALVKAKDAGRV